MKWFASSELAGMPGMPQTEQGVRKKAGIESWPFRRRAGTKAREYPLSALPPETQEAYIRSLSQEEVKRLSLDSDVKSLAPLARAEISRRCAEEILAEARDNPSIRLSDPRFLRDEAAHKRVYIIGIAKNMPRNFDGGRRAWIEHVALKYNISWQTIYRWLKKEEAAGLDGLMHGNRFERQGRASAWTPEALDYWKGLVLKREHRKMPMNILYRHLESEARARGWKIGCYVSAIQHARTIPAPLIAYRDGGARGLDNALPPIQRDYSDLQPFQILVGDQHRFDFWVRDDDTGELFRPECYLWQDLCTRTLYGFSCGRKYDSSMIGHALWVGLRIYGRFQTIYTDNGRPETAKYILERRKDMSKLNLQHATTDELVCDTDTDEDAGGILADLGATQRLAIVRNAKAKMIESTFRYLEEILVSMGTPGYCHRLGANKDINDIDDAELKALARAGKLMTYREFCNVLVNAANYYNCERPHRGLTQQHQRETGISTPITPRQYLLERVDKGWRPEYLSDRALDLIFLHRATRTVQRGRIRLYGSYYEHPALSDIANGETVELRYDPMDTERPVIVLYRGQYLCDAAPMEWGSMINDELTRSKISRKRELAARFRAVWQQYVSPVPDLRRYSTQPPVHMEQVAAQRELLKGAEALIEYERSRERTQEEIRQEIAAIEAKIEAAEASRPRQPLPPRPKIFLTEYARYKWAQEYILAGGTLNEEDQAFCASYEAKSDPDAIAIWQVRRRLAANTVL